MILNKINNERKHKCFQEDCCNESNEKIVEESTNISKKKNKKKKKNQNKPKKAENDDIDEEKQEEAKVVYITCVSWKIYSLEQNKPVFCLSQIHPNISRFFSGVNSTLYFYHIEPTYYLLIPKKFLVLSIICKIVAF